MNNSLFNKKCRTSLIFRSGMNDEIREIATTNKNHILHGKNIKIINLHDENIQLEKDIESIRKIIQIIKRNKPQLYKSIQKEIIEPIILHKDYDTFDL